MGMNSLMEGIEMSSNHVRSMLETPTKEGELSLPNRNGTMLEEVIRGLGHDPALVSVRDLQEIANQLSTMVKKETPWGWRYLRNVLNGKLEASTKLLDAVMRLGATIDSTPVELARSEQVTVLAVGHVQSGALILADSRRCANPGCAIVFVPRVPWQKCHSAECAQIWRKVKK